MRTTIAISMGARLYVGPSERGEVRLMIQTREGSQEGEWRDDTEVILSQDQAGALIFGLEMAAEAAELGELARKARAG